MRVSGTISWLIIASVSLVGLLAVVGFLFIWLQSQGDALKEAMQTIANEQALVQDQTRLTATLQATEVERAELQSYVLVGDDGAVELLSQIDSMAATLGVELSTSNLRVSERDGDFNDLILDLTFAGTEIQVKQLVVLFENLPYHADITELQLARSLNPNTGTNNMNGTISLRVTLASYDQ